MNKKSLSVISILLLLVQCALFGSAYIVLQIIIHCDLTPFLLIGCRFLIGAIALSIFCLSANKRLFFRNIECLSAGILCGTVMFLGFGFQTIGAYSTTSSNNAIFTGLYVIFTPMLSMILHKSFDIKLLLYALTAMIGSSLLSGLSSLTTTINIGDLFSIFCGFIFSLHFLLLEKKIQNVDIWTFTVIQLFTVSILSIFVSLIFEPNAYLLANWHSAYRWLLFMGIIQTSLTYIIQSFVQSHLEAKIVSVISCSETLFAVILSLLFGFSSFSTKDFLGSFFVIFSMIGVSLMSSDASY